MRFVCPHCLQPVEAADPPQSPEVVCPSCGSTFRLEGGSTVDLPHDRKLVGRFELLAPIGSGTFGTVYRALDPELARTVAVKLPRAGQWADSGGVERFLREARSAAQLRHPAIVPVHEVGTSEGVPYLVSDFIDGVTLADHLSGRRLAPPDAARLIAAVADALHYAHENGVVHRDVKPSNILLDAKGQPFITDFGLAKREAGEVTVTLDGQVLGTPAYMSPEQARGEAHKVDGRSDVYSLGVILYLLLTGELPFRGTARMLLYQVLHDDPRPPRALNDKIPRDLQTVCLKCLEKEPRKRYRTARELAGDLRRFLDGQPVQARPVGRLGRAWRWCRRKPAVAGLAAALMVALTLGFGGVVWKWREAERERTQAEANLAEVARQQQMVEQEKQKADENFREALQAVEDYFTTVSEDRLLNAKLPGLQPLRQDLLRAGLKYYQNFVAKRGDDPQLRLQLARAYTRMGQITTDVGSKQEAQKLLEKGRTLAQDLHRQIPSDPAVRQALAEAQARLAHLMLDSNQALAALEPSRSALELQQGLARERLEDPEAQFELAVAYNRMGIAHERLHNPPEALAAYGEAITLLERLVARPASPAKYRRLFAGALHNRGVIYADQQGQLERALEAFRRALAIQEGVVKEAPHDLIAQDYLVNHLASIAAVCGRMERADEALEVTFRALTIRAKVASENPTVIPFQTDLAKLNRAVGRAYVLKGQHNEGLPYLRRALEIQQRLVRLNPGSTPDRHTLALALNSLAVTYSQVDRRSEARHFSRLAVAEQTDVAAKNPQNLTFLNHLAMFQGLGAHIEMQCGRPGAAVRLVRQAVANFDRLEEARFGSDEFKQSRTTNAARLKTTEAAAQKAEQRVEELRREVGRLAEALRDRPEDAGARRQLAGTLLRCGQAQRAGAQPDNALDSLAEAARHYAQAAADDPKNSIDHSNAAASLIFAGLVHNEEGRPKEALSLLHQALAALAKLPRPSDGDLFLKACALAQATAAVGLDEAELPDEEKAQRRKFAEGAVQALRLALAAGYRDREGLQGVRLLDPVRGRDDFRQLQAQLSKKQ